MSWRGVTKESPCPICGKPDWCGRHETVIRCMRSSTAPAGWHVMKIDDHGGTTFRRDKDRPQHDLRALHGDAVTQLTQRRCDELAKELGVSAASLQAIDCGWNGRAWTFAERNEANEIIGLSTRDPAGVKRCIRNSKRGLCIPNDLPQDGLVCVVEGPSDVAAMHTMGIPAIGRPSAKGGAELLQAVVRDRDVLIVGENDKKPNGSHPGQEGAIAVARRLATAWRKPVRWALPPVGAKDMRDWLKARDVDVSNPQACRDAGRELLEMLNASTATIDPPADGSISADSDTSETQESERRPSQATRLVQLAADVELFRSNGDAYATIQVNQHRETWPVRSKSFRRWLARQYYSTLQCACNAQATQDALAVIEAKAIFEGPEWPVFTRLAEQAGNIYLDLCDEDWRVVEVTTRGWQVVVNPSVKFRRAKAMLPLPVPVRDGSIEELKPFLNVANDQAFILVVSWLLGTFRPGRPTPVLSLGGEQGSAKSTASRLLRSLIDPNAAPLRCAPRNPQDLMIAANNSGVLAFDNLSHIADWLSDAICRLATGGGFGTRKLYENDEETIFDALRPVLHNGIEETATRSDLLDRTIRVVLPAIPEDQRRTEKELWSAFARVRPRILGALLTAVSRGLRRIDAVKLPTMPRMADFAKWVVAAEPALPWPAGAFLAAYMDNCGSANELALEASPIAAAVQEFSNSHTEWTGTASELLGTLEQIADERTRQRKDWPKQPNILSNALRRIAPNLRKIGIEIEFDREKSGPRRRVISIRTGTQSTVRIDRDRPQPHLDACPCEFQRTMGGRSADDGEVHEIAVAADADDADDQLQPLSIASRDREEFVI